MSLVKAILLLIPLAVPVPSMGQGRIVGDGSTRRFVSPKYNFTMAVPLDWGVSTGLDTPVFFYAPSSERFVQASIPRGGAVITVEPHDTVSGRAKSATTPDAWARLDTSVIASKAPSIEPFQFPPMSRVFRAVSCSYDEVTYGQDERTQHSVAIFWEFDGHLFAAHLNYNAGDASGPAFEKLFLQAIRSIRPRDRIRPTNPG